MLKIHRWLYKLKSPLQLQDILHSSDNAGRGDSKHLQQFHGRSRSRYSVHSQFLDDDIPLRGSGFEYSIPNTSLWVVVLYSDHPSVTCSSILDDCLGIKRLDGEGVHR